MSKRYTFLHNNFILSKKVKERKGVELINENKENSMRIVRCCNYMSN